MNEQIRISGKNLGELALPDACPRCLWLKLKLHNRLPFQIFPGIFSSLDSYTKRVVHSWLGFHGNTPPWLSELGDIRGYREPPHHSQFQWLDMETNILLTGCPDGVLVRGDGSFMIVDYKTAKYSGNQDALYPMYETQVNVYKFISEQAGIFSPISGLALIYMEPITDESSAEHEINQREDGFAMGFSAKVHPVAICPEIIPPLLARTRELYEMAESPLGRVNCRNCQMIADLVGIA